MKIAIVGTGGIGSTFALHLAQAGHEVTVVARGKRLEQLQRDRAVVTTSGQRAAVQVSAVLDTTVGYDLVLASVLAAQVDGVLPALTASAARKVMFMFNTFAPLDRLRDAVGAARFAFGFPAILASLDDGKLTSQIVTQPFSTTVTDAAWAKIFTDAGIPTVTHADMQSWLRTHAAFVVPAMIASVRSYTRQAGISWSEAMSLAVAMDEGFRLVRHLGNSITPPPMVWISRLPKAAMATFLWTMSRVEALRKSGAAGPGEARALIDEMSAAAPDRTATLRAQRP